MGVEVLPGLILSLKNIRLTVTPLGSDNVGRDKMRARRLTRHFVTQPVKLIDKRVLPVEPINLQR